MRRTISFFEKSSVREEATARDASEVDTKSDVGLDCETRRGRMHRRGGVFAREAGSLHETQHFSMLPRLGAVAVMIEDAFCAKRGGTGGLRCAPRMAASLMGMRLGSSND